MKLLFAALSISLSIVNFSHAESTTLFDAEEQCKARQTTQGMRYIPPCTLPNNEFSFSIPGEYDDVSQEPVLAVNFKCESMRPLSLNYQLSREGVVISTGELAGSADIEQARSTFSLDKFPAEYTFKLIKLNGARGFQAIKPDCKLTAGTGDEEIDSATLAELTKVNIALWETTSRAVMKKSLIRYEINNAKYWLETIKGLLSPENTAVVTKLNDMIEQLSDILATCSNSYCGTTAIDKIKTLHQKAEQALISNKQLLDHNLEAYDFGSGKVNEEVTAWLQLRILINEALTPSKDEND
jgi:hypothetical protein